MTQKMVQDKVVVVTGAGGGIGRDMALALAAAGAKVVVNDIGTSTTGEGTDAGPAQKVVDEIKAAGGQAVANMDSVAESDAAGRIIQCALDHFGRIDGVVNNAGILRDRFFHKILHNRLVDNRKHFFGLRFGCRQKSRSKSRNRQNRFLDFRVFHKSLS